MMGQIDKLIARLKTSPKDFKFSELRKVLTHLKYEEDSGGKTSGSHVRFVNPSGDVIHLHKPHPGDEMKEYAIKEVKQMLEEREEI
jgi:predicted RNA binding protein YcfA (HicA-like mRNA interferase family)